MICLLVFDDACFQIICVALEELRILLSVFLCLLTEEPQDTACYGHAQLLHQARVLHALAADVEWHVLTVDDALNPMQPFWNDTISMLLHHHTPGVKCNTHFRIASEEPAWSIIRIRDVKATLD